MDITLEFVDTYFFDAVYAKLAPAPGLPHRRAVNATAAAYQAASPWQFKPASSFLSFTPRVEAYQSAWPRDHPMRQALTLFLVTWLAGAAIYFIVSTLSYIFIFDKATLQHPKFLKNQVRLEIYQAVSAMPGMSLLTIPFFLAEVRGHSKLYDRTAEGPGTWYNYAQFPIFLLFTDCFVYLIHRGLHHKSVYRYLHKAHHKWIMPSPYASIAFHPVDGFAQSIPYHVFPFIFPLQKFAYLGLFVFVQLWTVFIHDGEYVAKNPIINGAACHSIHHSRYLYNYGQYTTMWDRLGKTYMQPADEMYQKEITMSKTEWQKQAKEIEATVKEVEGHDDREYGHEESSTLVQKKVQ